MTDKEKQAIEIIKKEITKPETTPLEVYVTDIKMLLHIIDKQQKEIKELSEKLTEKICKGVEEEILEEYRQTIISKDKEIEELKKVIKMVEIYKSNGIPEDAEMVIMRKDDFLRNTNNEFISKDKIKKILGIEEDIEEEKILSLLQTIVDECYRLEDIEDRKVQVEYQNVFNKGVKSVEDKIREKIKELEEDIEIHNIYEENWNKINVLKELLEE